jgi:hypothetical protein
MYSSPLSLLVLFLVTPFMHVGCIQMEKYELSVMTNSYVKTVTCVVKVNHIPQ